MSTCEPNNCFAGCASALAPAVTDCVVKAASTSKLRSYYESSLDSAFDVNRDERSSTPDPSSLCSRRSVPAMYESVSKSKSFEFSRACPNDSEVAPFPSGRKLGMSNSPKTTRTVSRGYERAMLTDSKHSNLTGKTAEPRREPQSPSTSSGSIKKRHSFDILRFADESDSPGPGTTSSLPRNPRLGSESYVGVPNIVYSPQLNTSHEERTNGLNEGNSREFLGTPAIPSSNSLPIIRSASTGKMGTQHIKASSASPKEKRIAQTLPRNSIHPRDILERKSESPVVSTRRHEILSQSSRVCQSLPRGMNPKMLRMFSSAEKEEDPYEDFQKHQNYAQRSKSYEDLDKYVGEPEGIRSRGRESSKRWKLPFFSKGKSRDRQSNC